MLAVLFLGSFTGQVLSGFAAENNERMQEGEALLSFGGYLVSGAFLWSVFENWESEFLQMWAYVMLTAYLYQRGSPESRDPDVKKPPRKGEEPGRKRSFGQVIYEHSLGLTLLASFVVSFHSCCTASTRGAMPPRMRSRKACRSPPSFSISAMHSSGSKVSRTGRANSSQQRCSWCWEFS